MSSFIKPADKTHILIVDPAWCGKTGWLKCRLDKEDSPIVSVEPPCIDMSWGTLTSKEAKNWTNRFSLLDGVKTLIIEDTYFKYLTAQKALVRAQMLWTQVAIDHFHFTEKDIIYVPPQSWQALIQRGWRIGMDKDQKAIEFYIKHRWFNGKAPDLTEHEISCFGMLSFYTDVILKRKL